MQHYWTAKCIGSYYVLITQEETRCLQVQGFQLPWVYVSLIKVGADSSFVIKGQPVFLSAYNRWPATSRAFRGAHNASVVDNGIPYAHTGKYRRQNSHNIPPICQSIAPFFQQIMQKPSMSIKPRSEQWSCYNDDNQLEIIILSKHHIQHVFNSSCICNTFMYSMQTFRSVNLCGWIIRGMRGVSIVYLLINNNVWVEHQGAERCVLLAILALYTWLVYAYLITVYSCSTGWWMVV